MVPERIRVKVGIEPGLELDDAYHARLLETATEQANKISSTPVTGMKLITRATWYDRLGERPDDLRVDYLIYEGQGTRA